MYDITYGIHMCIRASLNGERLDIDEMSAIVVPIAQNTSEHNTNSPRFDSFRSIKLKEKSFYIIPERHAEQKCTCNF